MIRFISIFLLNLILQANAQAGEVDLDFIRANYSKAVADKKLCAKMIDGLKSVKDEPISLAYLGGLQTIWANHVFNPIAKLSTFQEGRRNIEKAVLKNPGNVEIRFIRLSVQKNAPSFLGYTSSIDQDSEFVKTHSDKITSNIVVENLQKLLKE